MVILPSKYKNKPGLVPACLKFSFQAGWARTSPNAGRALEQPERVQVLEQPERVRAELEPVRALELELEPVPAPPGYRSTAGHHCLARSPRH